MERLHPPRPIVHTSRQLLVRVRRHFRQAEREMGLNLETAARSPAAAFAVRNHRLSDSSRSPWQFNTTTSMGRLTLNVLLSFAQFLAISACTLFTEHTRYEVKSSPTRTTQAVGNCTSFRRGVYVIKGLKVTYDTVLTHYRHSPREKQRSR